MQAWLTFFISGIEIPHERLVRFDRPVISPVGHGDVRERLLLDLGDECGPGSDLIREKPLFVLSHRGQVFPHIGGIGGVGKRKGGVKLKFPTKREREEINHCV